MTLPARLLRHGVTWSAARLVLALGVSVAAVGAGVLVRQARTAEQPPAQQEAAPKPKTQVRSGPKPEPPIRTDRDGDPLPAGARARLGTVRFRHASAVSAVAFLPDGKTLVSAGQTIRLWDVATGRERGQFPGRHGTVYSVAVSPDGRLLAEIGTTPTGSFDDVIHLRDVASRKEIGQVPGDHSWDGVHGKVLGPIPRQLSAVVFAPDGKTLAAVSNPFAGQGQGANRAGVIRLWDFASGKQVGEFRSAAGPVHSLQFSPAGTLLAWEGDYPLLVLEDVARGKVLGRFTLADGYYNAGALSPDGKVVALGKYHPRAASRDSKPAIELRELAGGRLLHRLKHEVGVVTALAFAPDGKTLACAGGGHFAQLWDVATGKPLLPFEGSPSEVKYVSFTPDGQRLLAASRERTARLWEVSTGRQLRRVTTWHDWSQTVALSPDGRLLAAPDGPRLWDVATGKVYPPFEQHTEQGGQGVAFSPDGKLLAVPGPRSVAVQRPGNEAAVLLWDVATGKEVRRLRGGIATNSRDAVAFSPDGKLLAATNQPGTIRAQGEINVWKVSTGQEVRRFGPQVFVDYLCLAFSPNGRALAAGSREIGRKAAVLHVWDVATGAELRRWTGPSFGALSVAFSPSGRTLAAALAWEEPVHLWELATGEEICQFKGHRGAARSVAFRPDGRFLAAGGSDTTVLVWDVLGLGGPAPVPGPPLSAGELQDLWAALEGDAAKAYGAIARLATAPGQAAPFLKGRLAPLITEAQRMHRLIAQLDDDHFEVRQQATRELERLGEPAQHALREALAGPLAPEARSRVKRLLKGPATPAPWPHNLQALRAVEALEYMGTPEARQALAALVQQVPEAGLSREAKASLQRLAKRPAAMP